MILDRLWTLQILRTFSNLLANLRPRSQILPDIHCSSRGRLVFCRLFPLTYRIRVGFSFDGVGIMFFSFAGDVARVFITCGGLAAGMGGAGGG